MCLFKLRLESACSGVKRGASIVWNLRDLVIEIRSRNFSKADQTETCLRSDPRALHANEAVHSVKTTTAGNRDLVLIAPDTVLERLSTTNAAAFLRP